MRREWVGDKVRGRTVGEETIALILTVMVPDSNVPEMLSRIFLPSRKTTLMLMNSMSIL